MSRKCVANVSHVFHKLDPPILQAMMRARRRGGELCSGGPGHGHRQLCEGAGFAHGARGHAAHAGPHKQVRTGCVASKWLASTSPPYLQHTFACCSCAGLTLHSAYLVAALLPLILCPEIYRHHATGAFCNDNFSRNATVDQGVGVNERSKTVALIPLAVSGPDWYCC